MLLHIREAPGILNDRKKEAQVRMSGLTLLSCSTTLWIIAKHADYFICFLILDEKQSLYWLMIASFFILIFSNSNNRIQYIMIILISFYSITRVFPPASFGTALILGPTEILYLVPLPLPSMETTPFFSIDLSNSDTLLFPKGIFDDAIISLIGLAIVLLRTSYTILSSSVRSRLFLITGRMTIMVLSVASNTGFVALSL